MWACSKGLYDLRGEAIDVRIAGVINLSTTAAMNLGVEPAGNLQARIEMSVIDGMTEARYDPDGTGIVVAWSAVHDPICHAWLRIREEAGTIHWDVSADGASWTTVISLPVPFDVSAMRSYLSGGTWQAESTPGVGRFDDFNLR